SGILIGIGETFRERIEALLALRALHAAHGHLQEVIVQNFRAKPGTGMAEAPEPSLEEHLWTIAAARLIFSPDMSIQAPPNLNAAALDRLLAAGINDWGGVSPVTPDHVNPEAPWPQLEILRRASEAAGKELVARLAIYPRFVRQPERWLAPAMRTPVLDHSDAEGFAREDGWIAGAPSDPPAWTTAASPHSSALQAILNRARDGRALAEAEVVRLFAARGREAAKVCESADALRREVNGPRVGYVVNRNINYTNICYFHCRFCAFSKGKLAENLRGRPYDLDLGEIARRTREAWRRGATEMCLQGGIHPDYTGATYLEICRTVRQAAPAIHVHAFS
ncbi:MAG: radical SAM protein, partial [Burkholderiales bacterium]